jgi:hypothetical protein
MFTRFRQTVGRPHVSLVETRREVGRVRQDHVAALGSIGIPPSPADRIAFWTKLHQRLAGLSNRIDSKVHGEILTASHARIPMPMQDEHGATQLEHARIDAEEWHAIADMHASTAAEKRQVADERLARVERGEIVPGIPRRSGY